MNRIIKFFINLFLFSLISIYSVLFFFGDDILEESMYLVNKNIEGIEISYGKGDISLFKYFPFFEIKLDDFEIEHKDLRISYFKNVYIIINPWNLFTNKISIRKIKIVDGYADITSDILNLFDIDNSSDTKVNLKDFYLYSTRLKKDNVDLYFDNLAFKTKEIAHLKKIYIDSKGVCNGSYNFNTNTVLKVFKDSVEIGGYTKILNYKFKNKGKFDIVGDSLKNLEILFEERIENVSVLDYDTRTFNLGKKEKGDGFFLLKVNIKKDLLFGEKTFLYFGLSAKDVEINVNDIKIFQNFSADVKYSYTVSKNNINKELNIYNINSKLNDGYLYLQGFFKEDNEKYQMKLFSNSYIPKHTSENLFNNDINGSINGKIDFELDKKTSTVIKSTGNLDIKLDDIIFSDFKLKINTTIKNGKLFIEKSFFEYKKEVYNLIVSDINIIPFLLQEYKNKIKGNLQIVRKNFLFKCNFEHSISENYGIFRTDIYDFILESQLIKNLKGKSNISLDYIKDFKKFKSNKFEIKLGNTDLELSFSKDNKTSISISSKKGSISDIFTINNNFYLPENLKGTNYKELNADISIDSILDVKNISFFSEILKDNVIMKGTVLLQKDSNVVNNLYLVFGSTDLNIIRDNEYIYSVFSKYIDCNLFLDNTKDKNSNFELNKITIPKDKIYMLNLKSVSYDDNVFSSIESQLSTQNNKIKIDRFKAGYAGGNINIKGEFIISENSFFEGKIKFDNVKLENTNLKIDKNRSIKDNFHGDISLDSDAKIFVKNNGGFDFARSLIKNKIVIKKGKIIDYEPLVSIDKYFDENNLKEVSFDNIETSIVIYNNKILLPKTGVPSTIGHFYFSADIDFNSENEYKVFLPYDLYRKLYWNAILKLKKSEDGIINNQVKEKYQGEYKEITIIENKEEFKVII